MTDNFCTTTTYYTPLTFITLGLAVCYLRLCLHTNEIETQTITWVKTKIWLFSIQQGSNTKKKKLSPCSKVVWMYNNLVAWWHLTIFETVIIAAYWKQLKPKQILLLYNNATCVRGKLAKVPITKGPNVRRLLKHERTTAYQLDWIHPGRLPFRLVKYFD